MPDALAGIGDGLLLEIRGCPLVVTTRKRTVSFGSSASCSSTSSGVRRAEATCDRTHTVRCSTTEAPNGFAMQRHAEIESVERGRLPEVDAQRDQGGRSSYRLVGDSIDAQRSRRRGQPRERRLAHRAQSNPKRPRRAVSIQKPWSPGLLGRRSQSLLTGR